MFMKSAAKLSFIIMIVGLMGCSNFAVMTTPPKKARPSTSELSKQAEAKFWTTLHQGRYDDIPKAQALLTAAYLENPHDPKLAAHIGFLHIWQLAERQREKKQDPLIVNHAILAKKYFSDAIE